VVYKNEPAIKVKGVNGQVSGKDNQNKEFPDGSFLYNQDLSGWK
jgi:hypothetical protein